MAPLQTLAEAWYSPALDPPNVSEKNLARTRQMMAAQGNDGAAALKVGSALPEDKGSTFYPLFVSAIAAGLVPPFSEFFLSVLRLTTCKLCTSIPTLFFSWRFSPTTARLMSG